MKTLKYLIYMASLLIMSCSPQKTEADFIVENAKIYTVNENFEIAESFAVKDGKFIGVGTTKDIESRFKAKQHIDLKGKTVYPGFYDAHCHFLGYALGLKKVNLAGTNSYLEVIEMVNDHLKINQDEWIIGQGWDQNDWVNKELPDNELLNSNYPNVPVVLTRIDGHALLVNDEALKRAGININSKIEGGKFLAKNGKLTGVLVDNATRLVYKAIPVANKETKKKALLKAQQNCFEVGLTTVSDAGLEYVDIKIIEDLQKAECLKMRIYTMLIPTEENIENLVKKGPFASSLLNIRCIKLYADGALGSRGACLLDSYSDDKPNIGLILESQKYLKEICQTAYNYNYQVATHAIGDSANRLMLNIYAEILKTGNDRRWRIEHAQVIDKNDFSLFKKYTIIPSVQPTHATSDMAWAIDRLGAERIKYAYAYKTLLQQNKWIPIGSDFPIENINPLFGFYAAVSRMDFKFSPKGGFQPEEALTREEALRGMTIWAAKANFEENERGSIETGKLADFVVLDDDIMTIDIKQIFKVKVLKTFIGGKNVFDLEKN